MVLELHIWGSAFGLPSIDPHCLAAIAYLSYALRRDEWILVPTNDPSSSPTRELPVLRDGPTAVGGYDNIIEYLSAQGEGEWDLGAHLDDPSDKADVIALTSHINHHLPSLLALTLYHPENYPTTRHAWTSLLPFPTQYLIPPQQHSLARQRTAHLPPSLSLPTDHDPNDLDRHPPTPLAQSLTPNLNNDKPKTNTTTTLKQTSTTSSFRLTPYLSTVLRPLNTLLLTRARTSTKPNNYILSPTRPSPLDPLALSYLLLILRAIETMPEQSIALEMMRQYPELCSWAETTGAEIFDGEMPWVKDGNGNENVGMGMGKVVRGLLGGWTASPVIETGVVRGEGTGGTKRGYGIVVPVLVSVGVLAAGMGSWLGHWPVGFYGGEREEERRLEDLGEAGEVLAGLGF